MVLRTAEHVKDVAGSAFLYSRVPLHATKKTSVVACVKMYTSAMAHAPNFKNLTGKRFTRLLVIDLSHLSTSRTIVWKCICDCGTEKHVAGTSLRKGHSKSCGCLRSEMLTTHGMTKPGTNDMRKSVYRIWNNMVQRCHNPANTGYKYYGERGIKVCDGWRKFSAFYSYIGDRPSLEYSLERIDNDGNYEPGNVKWATKSAQRLNKRKPKLLCFYSTEEIMAELKRRNSNLQK